MIAKICKRSQLVRKTHGIYYTLCIYLEILCIVGLARWKNSKPDQTVSVFHTRSERAVRLFKHLEISHSNVHSHRQSVAPITLSVGSTLIGLLYAAECSYQCCQLYTFQSRISEIPQVKRGSGLGTMYIGTHDELMTLKPSAIRS